MGDKTNIIDMTHRFGPGSVTSEGIPSDPRAQRADEHRRRKLVGMHVWKTLNSRHKLSREDRTFIARNLDRAIRDLNASPEKLVSMAELGPDGTKELYRLRLPDGADPAKRRLRAHPRNYAKVIDAIAQLAGRNRSIVVDEITFGTSIHPQRAEKLEEADRYGRILQRLVNDVDKEFGLFQQFRDTLNEKLRCLESRSNLDHVGWPTLVGCVSSDLDPEEPKVESLGLPTSLLDAWAIAIHPDVVSDSDKGKGGIHRKKLTQARRRLLATRLPDLDLAEVDSRLRDRIETELDDYRRQLKVHNQLMTGECAFYDFGGDEGCCPFFIDIEAALPFLPHAYVGVVLEWSDLCPSGLASEKLDMRNWIRSQQVLHPRLVRHEPGGASKLVDFDENFSHAWLIIYPDRPVNELLPLLVVVDQYGVCASYGYHVDVRKLLELKEWGVIHEGKDSTVYERIEYLLGMDPSSLDENALRDAWRETAGSFRQNPLLQYRKARLDHEDAKLAKYSRIMAREIEND